MSEFFKYVNYYNEFYFKMLESVTIIIAGPTCFKTFHIRYMLIIVTFLVILHAF